MLPMELRTLTPEELKVAYKKELRATFPINELRPLRSMKRLQKRGAYEPLAAFVEGRPVGYAFLWRDEEGYLLFDYLAVTAAMRQKGLGTALLQAVLERCGDAPAIFGEVEAPLGRDAAQDALICRRLAFYERNGIVRQGYDCKLFGVHYHVVGRVRPEIGPQELMAHHLAFYRHNLNPRLFARFVQIPFLPGQPDLNGRSERR